MPMPVSSTATRTAVASVAAEGVVSVLGGPLAAASVTGVVSFDDFVQSWRQCLRIQSGSGQVSMAQKKLNRSQICSPLIQMSRKGSTECVGGKQWHVRFQRIFLDPSS